MREILFTGKCPVTNLWTFGTGILNDGINTWIVNNPIGTAIKFGETHTKVIAETVGEYTGIDDKNGIKVFEHFIVKWASQYFAVEWHHTKFVLKKDLRYEMFDYVLACFDGSEFEVVGNIYDNPELLNRGAE